MRPLRHASFAAAISLLTAISCSGQSAITASSGTSSAPARTSTAAVEPIPLDPHAPVAQSAIPRKTKYDLNVTPGGWQATAVQLLPGDQVDFRASGAMTIDDGRDSKPAGAVRQWKDLLRIFPLTSAGCGALIGRIGSQDAALPFLIGAADTLTAPAAGELYLRANLSPDLTAEGSYSVRVELHSAPASSATAGESGSQVFARQLSPEIFNAIPRRVSDRQGNLGDMVNFALVGTEQQVKAALEKAGWFPTDASTEDALVHGLLQTLEHKSYMAVPMSTLYLFGRPQELAYARANAIEVAATRNHLRLWNSPETVDGLPLWVGSATHDHGFETDQRTGGVTHHIDPDIDQERAYILASLKDAGAVKAAAYVRPSNPVGNGRTATGGSFTTDGRIVVLLLQ